MYIVYMRLYCYIICIICYTLHISFAVCGPREMNKAQVELTNFKVRLYSIKSSAIMSTSHKMRDQLFTVSPGFGVKTPPPRARARLPRAPARAAQRALLRATRNLKFSKCKNGIYLLWLGKCLGIIVVRVSG